MMEYGPAHRLFLQVMTQRRSLGEEEAVDLMKSFCQEYKEKVQSLDTFVQEMNSQLEDVELALRSTVEEREDSDYPCLVLVNLMAHEVTRALSTFSQQELAFVRLLVGEIVASEEGELKMNDAINLGLSLKHKMKATACEKLVERLVEEKWLLLNNYMNGEECVSLSSLIIAEINTYLEEIHGNNILKCFFCTKITLKGYQCQQCGIGVHRDCAKRYWDTSKKENSCPGQKCSAFLGPAPGATKSKRSRVRLASNEEEEEEEDQELEPMQEKEEVSEVREKRELRVVTRKGRVRGKVECGEE